MLGDSGLAERARVVMEKPFGSDLGLGPGAQRDRPRRARRGPQCSASTTSWARRPTQNILAFRFANGLFEPAWNRDHIAYVQIDVPEDLGIEGRASFYEETGAFRDMVVTHLMQLLGFVAMEPPRAPRRAVAA